MAKQSTRSSHSQNRSQLVRESVLNGVSASKTGLRQIEQENIQAVSPAPPIQPIQPIQTNKSGSSRFINLRSRSRSRRRTQPSLCGRRSPSVSGKSSSSHHPRRQNNYRVRQQLSNETHTGRKLTTGPTQTRKETLADMDTRRCESSVVDQESLLDEKAALQAADQAAEKLVLDSNQTPQEQPVQPVQSQIEQLATTQTQTVASPFTPNTSSTSHTNGRRSSIVNRPPISLQRRLALANLPPITPVTTRSKERAATAAEASINDQLAADLDAGIPSEHIDLATNTDYIALTSTLELLESQRTTASEDILTLQRLKAAAIADPQAFVDMLRRSGSVEGAPSMQTVVRAPVVRWGKYGVSNELLEAEVEKGVVDRDPRLGPVQVFRDSARKASV
ncbi:uncharacterized protein V1516DRAFT_671095 [Lipomyces oligophaga]|uniref:uncharacterized protein n=1 Tax=Lipomyces oligophaga TaxID=45792 RepID=UPI0034CF3A41